MWAWGSVADPDPDLSEKQDQHWWGGGVPANYKRFELRLLEMPYFYNMRDGRIEILRILASE